MQSRNLLYDLRMGLKTIAFEAAEARGWSIAELAQRSGLSIYTLYQVRMGRRAPGHKVIAGLMRAFPDLPFERLFVPVDSAIAQSANANAPTRAA